MKNQERIFETHEYDYKYIFCLQDPRVMVVGLKLLTANKGMVIFHIDSRS